MAMTKDKDYYSNYANQLDQGKSVEWCSWT